MLINWLEPVIEINGDKINDEVIKTETKDVYDIFITLIKNNNSINCDNVLDLENAFLLAMRNGVKIAYKRGLEDGINIYRQQ